METLVKKCEILGVHTAQSELGCRPGRQSWVHDSRKKCESSMFRHTTFGINGAIGIGPIVQRETSRILVRGFPGDNVEIVD